MSVTAVPLRPVSRRALVILWIGIAVMLVAGISLAWAGTNDPTAEYLRANAKNAGVVTTDSGLQYQVLEQGTGPGPTDADVALIGYRGTFPDGEQFDANPQTPMPVAGVVPGFSEGLKLMGKGAKYRFWIKPELGYGSPRPTGAPPMDAQMQKMAQQVLVFDVPMFDFLPEQVIRQMQMQQQMGGAAPGGPGGPPPGAMPPAP